MSSQIFKFRLVSTWLKALLCSGIKFKRLKYKPHKQPLKHIAARQYLLIDICTVIIVNNMNSQQLDQITPSLWRSVVTALVAL